MERRGGTSASGNPAPHPQGPDFGDLPTQIDFGELPVGSPASTRVQYGGDAQADDYTQPPPASPVSMGMDADATQIEMPRGPLAFLIIQRPVKYRGQVFPVPSGSIFGRKDADVNFNEPKMSRQHGRVTVERNDDDEFEFAIYDFGTPNHTYVNGKQILGRSPLQENDEIQVGSHVFVFKVLQ
jgi:hypothetical protein